MVVIKHDNGYSSVYAHNKQIVVKEGQHVDRGQKIAEMGSTDSSEVRLHFELRHQGIAVDPARVLPPR
jgi:lipoprotein NlpD